MSKRWYVVHAYSGYEKKVVLKSSGEGYQITSVGPDGSTVVSIVLLTKDGYIIVLSWVVS